MVPASPDTEKEDVEVCTPVRAEIPVPPIAEGNNVSELADRVIANIPPEDIGIQPSFDGLPDSEYQTY